MTNSFDFFENQDVNFKNSPIIKERVSLIASHMYKQFLNYQKAAENTAEIFGQMIECLEAVVDSLRQTFASHGVATQNIYLETDNKKSIAVLTIFWHKFSFTTRCNYQPQALYRENDTPVQSGRIMAIKGNYNELMKQAQTHEDEMKLLLEEEIASLFVPDDKSKQTICKVKHIANREFYLPHIDAAREFALKCIEVVCGNSIYHEEGVRKSFNI
ncbi:hypothetical protein IJ818_01990 [bacterium]|nr:hypothetical protein [bacterium]